MLTSLVVRIVDFCSRQAWLVIVAEPADCDRLQHLYGHATSPSIPTSTRCCRDDIGWRKRERAFEKAFGRFERIIVVVQAPTPELAGAATDELAEGAGEAHRPFSQRDPARRRRVFRPQRPVVPADRRADEKSQRARPGRGADQRPRHRRKPARPHQRARRRAARHPVGEGQARRRGAGIRQVFRQRIEDVVAGRPASFSWQALVQGGKAERTNCAASSKCVRSWITRRLSPATRRPQRSARSLPASRRNIRRRCGSPDRSRWPTRNSRTIKENIVLNGLITLAIVLFILWMALRSARLILAVFINVFVGLAITAAVGLLLVGALNPDIGVFRGSVRRHRRRLRHSIQRALSRRASRATRPARPRSSRRADCPARR